MTSSASLARKIRPIKLLILDVDGVMTDGGLYYSADGVELKRFNAHDGYGIVRAHEHDLKLAIITGRSTPIVEARARTLHIEEVYQDAMDKVSAMAEIRSRQGLADREIAFIGDDLFDLPLLRIVGFSAAPANAVPEVRKQVDYVTRARGGDGAVRELIDLIIRNQRRVRKKQ
jgi:3-deoxy-D-manno-octulosonate 8-phosphate phosphatase (KDO 8-P phosphatase)